MVSSTKPSPTEFANFYSGLFSHCDRPSNDIHRSVKLNVSQYAESISSNISHVSFTDEEKSSQHSINSNFANPLGTTPFVMSF